jgi:gliding motility-associated-like protein
MFTKFNNFLFILMACAILANAQPIGGIINNYTKVISINNCNNTIVVSSTNNFTIGDTVLIIQMKGAIADTSNTVNCGNIISMGDVGNYEMNEIIMIAGNTITFKYNLIRTYNTTIGFVQLIRVPFYNNPIITSTLTCSPWNGITGGVLVLNSNNSITLNSNIDVSNNGFRGGQLITGPSCGSGLVTQTNYNYDPTTLNAAAKGESVATTFSVQYNGGKGAMANGGGGGNNHNAGGAGGGNYGLGGNGGEKIASIFNCPGANPGIGGKTLTYSNLTNKIFMGGGGGAGHDNNNVGQSGGNGGGIVIIIGNSITNNSNFIKANGANRLMADGDGGGGGGGGGTIILNLNTSTDSLKIETLGGKGSDQNNAGMAFCIGPGGGGGGGSIWHKNATMPFSYLTKQLGGSNGITINANCNCPTGVGSANNALPGLTGGKITQLQFPIANVLNNTFNSNIGNDTSICSGSIVNLFCPIGSQFIWSGNTSSLSCTNCQNPIANPTITSTYIVNAINGNCNFIDTIVITVIPSPNLNIVSNDTICLGNSLALNALGGAGNFNWTPNIGLSCTNCASPIATPSVSTGYQVVASLAVCIDTATINIVVQNVPISNAGLNDSICNGNTIMLNASPNAGAGYMWFPNSTLSCNTCLTPIASPTVTTTYNLITYLGTCADTSNVIISVSNYPALNIPIDTFICIGDTMKLTANTNAINFSWLNQNNISCNNCLTTFVYPITSQYYTFQSTNNNCINKDSVLIQVFNYPIANAGLDIQICSGLVATLNTNNSSAGSILWQPIASFSCNNCPIVNLNPVSTADYYLSINNNGCVTTDTVKITVNTAPNLNLGNDTSICLGSVLSISANTNGNNFNWLTNAVIPCTSCLVNNVNLNASTTFYASSSIGNCVTKDTLVIIVDTFPIVSIINSQTICQGQTISLPATGTGNFIWAPAASLSCNNCATPIANPINTTTYTIYLSNGNCIDTSQTVVIVQPLPMVDAGLPVTICKNGSVTLSGTASAGATFNWSPSNNLSCSNCLNPTVSPSQTTTYSLTATLGNCSSTDIVVITVKNINQIVLSNDTSICKGSQVNLIAQGSSNYNWLPNIGLSCNNCNNPIASPNITTTYLVYNNLPNSCTDTNFITITVLQPNASQLNNDVTIAFGDTTTLTNFITNNYYCWQLNPNSNICVSNNQNYKVSPPYTTTYYHTSYNSIAACPAILDSITVFVNFDASVGIPNSFSPNNDNLNDYFMPIIGNSILVEFKIFSRWGELLFSTSDKTNKGWDGYFKGIAQPIGSYVYFISLADQNNHITTRKGDVTIIR